MTFVMAFLLFPEAPTYCDKKSFEIIFAALYFHFYEPKKCVSDFLKNVFFSRSVQLKSSFSDTKMSAVKSETNVNREAIRV